MKKQNDFDSPIKPKRKKPEKVSNRVNRDGLKRYGFWLNEKLMDQVDEHRYTMPYTPSLPKWVTEAIREKLQRELDPSKYTVEDFIKGGIV